MECKKCSGLMEILRESIRVLSKNKKLMTFIVILSIILSQLLFILNILVITPLVQDLVFGRQYSQDKSNLQVPDMNNPSATTKRDLGLLMIIEWIFILATLIVSLMASSATIFVSAMSYSNQSLSFKDVLLDVATSLKPLFITSLYTGLIACAYIFLLVIILFPIYLISDTLFTKVAFLIVLGSVAAVLFIYFSVSWSLALVITVIEKNSYGFKALGKAEKLIKGNRLNGFALTLLFDLLHAIIYYGIGMVKHKQSLVSIVIVELFRMSFLRLLITLLFIAYTVLYFRCKETSCEEIEFKQGASQFLYSELPIEQTFKEDIP